MEQLITGAVGDPDVAVRGDTDAHQSEEFLFEGEVALLGDGTTLEIHHEELAIEAGRPDMLARDRCAPADTVDAHAGEASDRRRERLAVGTQLDDAAANALDDAGLRAGHPVLAAPKIAFRIEHEPTGGVDSATREAKREGEVGRGPHEIRHERRRTPRAVFRFRVGFVEQRIEFLRVGPWRFGDPAIASSVFFGVAPPIGVAALKRRARQSSSATVREAVMSEPSVFKFARAVVCVLLSGSSNTLPQPPVAGSTRFGVFPAAIFSPSGLPEMASPLMKRAAVNAEATVVSSFTVTVFGNEVPSSDISTRASLAAFAPPAVGVPPLATR